MRPIQEQSNLLGSLPWPALATLELLQTPRETQLVLPAAMEELRLWAPPTV